MGIFVPCILAIFAHHFVSRLRLLREVPNVCSTLSVNEPFVDLVCFHCHLQGTVIFTDKFGHTEECFGDILDLLRCRSGRGLALGGDLSKLGVRRSKILSSVLDMS